VAICSGITSGGYEEGFPVVIDTAGYTDLLSALWGKRLLCFPPTLQLDVISDPVHRLAENDVACRSPRVKVIR